MDPTDVLINETCLEPIDGATGVAIVDHCDLLGHNRCAAGAAIADHCNLLGPRCCAAVAAIAADHCGGGPGVVVLPRPRTFDQHHLLQLIRHLRIC